MKIKEIRLVGGDKILTADPADVSCDINEKSELTVTARHTELRKIIIKTDVVFGEDTEILCDAFERGYGTLGWRERAGEVMPWYFMAKCGDKIRCFGVKTQPNAICWWKIVGGSLYFVADIGAGGCGVRLGGRRLSVCTFVEREYSGSSYAAARKFCAEMCDSARGRGRSFYGGNDWYCCYGENSFDSVISHTEKIAECAEGLKIRPYMTVDDGWQQCWSKDYNGGPWRRANEKFGDMARLAEKIKEFDVLPGIWLRPLLTAEKYPAEYMLSGREMTLDPSVPEVLGIIGGDIAEIKSWGYRLIKHDFTTFDIFGKWGFEFGEDFTDGLIFYDKKRTTAEIIKDMYRTIRRAAGEDIAIIGCNTLSHLSAGFFEIQRTGDDTSGTDFSRTRTMGVNSLAFRMPQHGSFYAADADCVGITTKIDFAENKKWLDVLAKSGTPLFVSIEAVAYTDEVRKAVREAFRLASENTTPSEPLDWEQTEIPSLWQSAYGTDKYEWQVQK